MKGTSSLRKTFLGFPSGSLPVDTPKRAHILFPKYTLPGIVLAIFLFNSGVTFARHLILSREKSGTFFNVWGMGWEGDGPATETFCIPGFGK